MPACLAQKSHSHSKVMDIFRTLGSGSLSVTAMLDFSGKANASIHGLGGDDTANIYPPEVVGRGSETQLQVGKKQYSIKNKILLFSVSTLTARDTL